MRPPRLRSFSYTGIHRYFLTFCTHRRDRVFTNDLAVSPILSQLRLAASRYQFEITAYCFMPDHLHVLVTATSDSCDLRRFAKTAKQATSFDFSRITGRRLWQDGFYDHVIRGEEDTLAIARYVVSNPVRAGLVATVDEYPFAGSDRFSMREIAESVQVWSPRMRRRA